MKKAAYIVLVALFLIIYQSAYSQESELDMEFEVTDEQIIVVFLGFIFAVIALFLYLARDIIRKKKTEYDQGEFDSKKNRDYEKYHSDWSDDYEDFGKRKYVKEEKEFQEAIRDSSLPNYYKVLGVTQDATTEEIKKRYRELAKKLHPDKSKKEDTKDKMAEINKAYETLSDEELRAKYDRYFKQI